MAERSQERTRNRSSGVDIDALTGSDEPDSDRTAESPSSGRLARLKQRAGSLFSLRWFLVALLTTVLGAVLAGIVIPFFSSLAALGGIFAVGFAFGIFSSRRRYLELGIAGSATAAVGTFTEFLVVALAGQSQLLAVFGVGSGLLAALLGHYLGRDLRSGMTRDI